MKPHISAERLRELLQYDEETGLFYRKRLVRNGGGQKVGDKAGFVNKHIGYAVINVDGRSYYAHRLAFLYMTGRLPLEVDHKNLVKSDNRWSNLRECTLSQNRANRAVDARNKLGKKGVSLLPSGKFKAEIRANKKSKHLGVFDTVDAAHAAYVNAATAAFGEFANAGVLQHD
jgi:hypothetical protein